MPRLHSISLAEYQALALDDDFDAHKTLDIGGAFISIGRHRDLGLVIIGCTGPDGGFVAELEPLPARRTEAAS